MGTLPSIHHAFRILYKLMVAVPSIDHALRIYEHTAFQKNVFQKKAVVHVSERISVKLEIRAKNNLHGIFIAEGLPNAFQIDENIAPRMIMSFKLMKTVPSERTFRVVALDLRVEWNL
ncbi:hypothetical protein CEXT_14471 [Caerostris extrusa]|uniref:Uncharacterized protein n=1 Tax=Caerostris extrusa TaxID=172846 RepID=A0AAV4X042_CAEEX|nr:hypothetical protein CEXT_14471 [Caerostris extrusa]